MPPKHPLFHWDFLDREMLRLSAQGFSTAELEPLKNLSLELDKLKSILVTGRNEIKRKKQTDPNFYWKYLKNIEERHN